MCFSRMLRITTLASCLILLSELPSQAQTTDGSSLFKQIRPYVVGVSAKNSGRLSRSGSGVVIGVNEILTNCHVIDGAGELSIEFSDGEIGSAIPGERVGKLDLCILAAKTGARKFPKPSPVSSIKVGQRVFALGNPLSLTESFSDGLISGIRKRDGQTVLQTTAPISPGSSGGGLFDSAGRLVGITTFTLVRGQNLNFAIPAEYIKILRDAQPKTTVSAGGNKVTFKGVPFGSSTAIFLETFPGAKCNDIFREQVHCVGNGIEYLGRVGSYFAQFYKERFAWVIFKWAVKSEEDPKSLARYIQSRVEAYFGSPTSDEWAEALESDKKTVGFQIVARWEVSKEQSISVGFCTSGDWMACEGVRGAYLELDDKRFPLSSVVPTVPQKDF
jgi:hypothetical protein